MDYKLHYFKAQVEPELNHAQTAEEMLHVLLDHYHLDDPLKMMTSLAFRQGLRTAITMLNPEPKNHVSDLNWAAPGSKTIGRNDQAQYIEE